MGCIIDELASSIAKEFEGKNGKALEQALAFVEALKAIKPSVNDGNIRNQETDSKVTSTMDRPLFTKILNKLKELYPEIKLEFTSKDIEYRDMDGSVMNQEEYSNKVNLTLKLIDTLYSLGTAKPSKHGGESQPVRKTVRVDNEQIKTNMAKMLASRGVPKEQIALMFEYMKQNDIGAIGTLELAEKLLFGLSTAVEINTARDRDKAQITTLEDFVDEAGLDISGADPDFIAKIEAWIKNKGVDTEFEKTLTNDLVDILEQDEIVSLLSMVKGYTKGTGKPTKYYSALSVPGGSNYKELEIKTPGVEASKKGHAKFATDEGIGWYRADTAKDGALRVLEMQSDMFQKMKGLDLTVNKGEFDVFTVDGLQYVRDAGNTADGLYAVFDGTSVYGAAEPDYVKNIQEKDAIKIAKDAGVVTTAKSRNLDNSLHQLLNTNNKWVKFFIQSIVQNATRNGYEDIRFPHGDTVWKIEGYTQESNSQSVIDFYNKQVKNTLLKTYGKQNIQEVTDEHGNKWFELKLDNQRDSQNIMFQKDTSVAAAVLQPGSNSLLAEVKRPINAKKIVSSLEGFTEKDEVHLTVLGFPQGKELTKIFEENPEKKAELENLIATADFSYTPTDKVYKIERDREAWVDWKEPSKGKETLHEEAVIQLVEAPGVERFIKAVNKLLDTNFPVPFPHISLGVKGTKFGIGLANKEAFDAISKEKINVGKLDTTKVSYRPRIKGQADLKAMSILIDERIMTTDTLPHEYAHHYINWFRDTPIVQEAIKKWGSEEALVQAIGEQVVEQKGEAYNWWKKFSNWVKNVLQGLDKKSKEELRNLLTDAFLERKDLREEASSKPTNGTIDKIYGVDLDAMSAVPDEHC